MPQITDATLTKTQRNRILQVIREYCPPPDDFGWTEKECEGRGDMVPWMYRVSVLTHRPTGYYCIFGYHSVTTCPGLKRKVESFSHDDRWAIKENACGRWLVLVKEEVEAPDLWASLGQETLLSTAASSPNVDNRPFSPEEHRLIFTKLDQIKSYLLEGQQFATEQAKTIEREFIYLRESSERLGRKDWLNNLLGGLVGLAIGLALDPEKARGLLRLAGAVFESLWHVGSAYLR